MCWMSEHIDEAIKQKGYKTGEPHRKGTQIHKIIFADDGTYFTKSREDMQIIADAIAEFCAATGIVVKPEKNYVYSNTEGEPIK